MIPNTPSADAVEASDLLRRAADEMERRGQWRYFWCPPTAAKSFKSACEELISADEPLPDGIVLNGEDFDIVDPDITLPETSEERLLRQRDCPVCAGGAINWLLTGDVEDTDWASDQGTQSRFARAIAKAMVAGSPDDEVWQCFTPGYPIDFVTAMSVFNDTHDQVETVAALRRAADALV